MESAKPKKTGKPKKLQRKLTIKAKPPSAPIKGKPVKSKLKFTKKKLKIKATPVKD